MSEEIDIKDYIETENGQYVNFQEIGKIIKKICNDYEEKLKAHEERWEEIKKFTQEYRWDIDVDRVFMKMKELENAV